MTRKSLGRRSQTGSAYVLTLMVLVILTLAGMSLALITQTERQLGSNERSMQTTFYAADSGIALGTARTLALNEQSSFEVVLDKYEPNDDTALANRIQISPFQQILPMPCNYCEINQGSQYYNVNHAVNSTAERVVWDGTGLPPDNAVVVGRSSVGSMVEIQPWQVILQDPDANTGGLEEVTY